MILQKSSSTKKLPIEKNMTVPFFYHFYHSTKVKTTIFTKRVLNERINGEEICQGFSDHPFVKGKVQKINE